MIEFKEKIPFSLLGIGSTVHSIEDLAEELELVVTNRACKPVISPCFIVGDSSKKIVDCIEREYCRD